MNPISFVFWIIQIECETKKLLPKHCQVVYVDPTFWCRWQKCKIWFKDILQTMSWFFLKFGHGMHNIMKNNRGKFQLSPMHGF